MARKSSFLGIMYVLLLHASKGCVRILERRIRRIVVRQLSDVGFVKGLRCMDAIIRQMIFDLSLFSKVMYKQLCKT